MRSGPTPRHAARPRAVSRLRSSSEVPARTRIHESNDIRADDQVTVDIGRDGRIPISTFGGLKARGNPVGATGVYQIVEVTNQLRGAAGESQVPDARIGMAQNLGGSGATAVTHVLVAGG